MRKINLKNNTGITLVEVVIGAAIIASSFVAVIGIYATLTRYSSRALPRMQASMLTEEGIEALRAMRDAGYASQIGTLNTGTNYYLSWSTASSTYIATTTPVITDTFFTRTITVANAYRDGSYNLATTGTNDTNTKLVTVTVSWLENNATSTHILKSYVSNIFSN